MAQDQDDTYGIVDPDELLQQQSDAYARAQQNPNLAARMASAGLQGLENANGGGYAVQKARQVQSQLQSIMQGINQGSDPNEDPLTKQLRTASAIGSGMMGISPQIALRAQDQAVRLAQAQSQQKLLNVKMEQEQTELGAEKFKANVLQNTPQTMTLVADQGKDENGLPLGYKDVKTYDLTDANSAAQIRADMMQAQQNGQSLIPMTPSELANSRVQVAASNAQARYQSAMLAAQAREQAAAIAAQKSGVQSSMNERFSNRILSASDLGSAALTNIASMPFGTHSGWFGTQYGMSPGASLYDMTSGNLRNALSTQDQQLYNNMVTGMYRNLAMVEQQGGLQGGQQFAESIRSALQLRPTDTPLTVMSKLADARQILDRGTEVYLKSKTADPQVVDMINARLNSMHKAIPFTQQDVIAFDRAQQKSPELTFSQWAQSQGLNGTAQNSPSPFTTLPMGKDENGVPAKRVYGGGKAVENNGQPAPPFVQTTGAASRGYGSTVDKGLYGGQ
jgi:hypothetical protein